MSAVLALPKKLDRIEKQLTRIADSLQKMSGDATPNYGIKVVEVDTTTGEIKPVSRAED